MDALMAAAENLCLIHGDASGVFKPDPREESVSQVVEEAAEPSGAPALYSRAVKPSLDHHASAPEERTNKQVNSTEAKDSGVSRDDVGGNNSGTTGSACHPSASRKFCTKLEEFAASAALVEAEENHGGPFTANELNKEQLFDSLPRGSPDAVNFSAGDLVWAKVKSHPWWPGQIFDAEDASKVAKKKQKPGRLLVAFFGDGTYAWLQMSQLLDFKSHFKKNLKQTSMRSFCNAVEEALEEVCRRSELGLSCSCRGEVFHSTSTFPDRNIGIQNMGLRIKSHRDILMSKEMLSANKLLEFVKDVARSPFGCWNSSLEASELRGHAFGVRTGIVFVGRSSTSVPADELKVGIGKSCLNPLSKRKVPAVDRDGLLEAVEGAKPKKTKSDELLQKPSCTRECLTELSQSQQSGSKRKATEVLEDEAREEGQQGAVGVEGRISGLEVKSAKEANADVMTEGGAEDDMETLLAIGGFNSKLLRKVRKVNKCMAKTSTTRKGKSGSMQPDHAQSCTSSNASSPNMSNHDSSATSCVQGSNQVGTCVPAERKGNLDQDLLDHEVLFMVGTENDPKAAVIVDKVECEGLSSFAQPLDDKEVHDSVTTSMNKDSSEACAISCPDNQAQVDAVICTKKAVANAFMVQAVKASATSESSFIPSSNQQGEVLNLVTQSFQAQADVVEKPVKAAIMGKDMLKHTDVKDTLLVASKLVVEKPVKAAIMGKDMEKHIDDVKDTLLVANKHVDMPPSLEAQADVCKRSLTNHIGDTRGTLPPAMRWDVPQSVRAQLDGAEKPGKCLVVIEDTIEATDDVSGILLVAKQEEIPQSLQAQAITAIDKTVKAVNGAEGMRVHTGDATCLVTKLDKDQISTKKISSMENAKQSSNKESILSTSASTFLSLNQAGFVSQNVLSQHLNCLKLLARDSLSKASLGNKVEGAVAALMRFREFVYQKSSGYGGLLPQLAEQNLIRKANTQVKTDYGHLNAQVHSSSALSSPKNEMHELLLAARRKKSEILQEEKSLREREEEFFAQKQQLSKLGVKTIDGNTGEVIISDTRVPRRSANVLVGLFMKFPQGFTIPSESQLRDMFVQFGALKTAGTKVYKNAASARVVFKRVRDAEVAFKYAKRKRLFGEASIAFRLKRLSEPGRPNEESFLPPPGEKKVAVREEPDLSVQLIHSPERPPILHGMSSITAHKEDILPATDKSMHFPSTSGSDRHISTLISSDILDNGRASSDADECMPSPASHGPNLVSCNAVDQVSPSVDGKTSKLPGLHCGHEELSISGPIMSDIVDLKSASGKVEAVSVAIEDSSQGDMTCNLNSLTLNSLPGVNEASRDIQDQLLKLLQQVSVLVSSPN